MTEQEEPKRLREWHRLGRAADQLIKNEVHLQDAMWGMGNERSDATQNQLIQAANAQLALVGLLTHPGLEVTHEQAMDAARDLYPQTWSGFRDYGSPIANLVVVAAYVRNEIKRRLAAGEECVRVSRDGRTQPYCAETGLPLFTTADPDWASKAGISEYAISRDGVIYSDGLAVGRVVNGG